MQLNIDQIEAYEKGYSDACKQLREAFATRATTTNCSASLNIDQIAFDIVDSNQAVQKKLTLGERLLLDRQIQDAIEKAIALQPDGMLSGGTQKMDAEACPSCGFAGGTHVRGCTAAKN